MGNKILVTGGSGLVGSEFVGEQYYKPTSKDVDFRITNEVNTLIELNDFDAIIHCAAKVGGIGSNMKYKGDTYLDNSGIFVPKNYIIKAPPEFDYIEYSKYSDESEQSKIVKVK